MQNWLHQLLEKLNLEQTQQLACTLWVIWNRRNNEFHGEARKNSEAAANFVKQYLREFNAVMAKVEDDQGRWQPSQLWRPISNDVYKLNFDGAINLVERKGGIGIIIRNDEGAVMGAYAAANWMLCVHL